MLNEQLKSAVVRGDIDELKKLIDAKVDINCLSYYDAEPGSYTPLMMAAYKREFRIREFVYYLPNNVYFQAQNNLKILTYLRICSVF